MQTKKTSRTANIALVSCTFLLCPRIYCAIFSWYHHYKAAKITRQQEIKQWVIKRAGDSNTLSTIVNTTRRYVPCANIWVTTVFSLLGNKWPYKCMWQRCVFFVFFSPTCILLFTYVLTLPTHGNINITTQDRGS